ncbi:MAG TPA: hypothetical protein VNH39_01160 [Steroidobacteraceae bacterium]|nr:hypothetical protein [Steroidobacteraceae bacterium]
MTLSIRGVLGLQRSVTIGTVRKSDLVDGDIALPVVVKIGGDQTASLYFREGKKLSRISGGFDINQPFEWIENYAKRLAGLGAKVAVADLNLRSYEEFGAG